MIFFRTLFLYCFIVSFLGFNFCSYRKSVVKLNTRLNSYQEIEENLVRSQHSFNSQSWKKSALYLDIVLYDLDRMTNHADSIQKEFQKLSSYQSRVYAMYDKIYTQEMKQFLGDVINFNHREMTKWVSKILSRTQLDNYTLPIPQPVPQKVIQYIVQFLTHERENFSIWLKRFYYFQNFIKKELQEKELPVDLIYVAMIESGFNIRAYSSASAAGLWQFIKPTARIFDLKMNWWFDERRDPVKATRAAISYLTYLYKEFNSWDLALAAYNAGEGRVRSQIRKNNRDYWTMKLPKETKNYVARILAAMIIGNDPEKYGFYSESDTEEIFGVYDTITIFHSMHLDFIAEKTGTTRTYIQKLNPELKRWTTPPNLEYYSLRIPLGSRSLFLEEYKNADKGNFVRWSRHQIKKGETLGHIALQYQVPISVIRKANKMKNNLIVAGRFLLVPNMSHN